MADCGSMAGWIPLMDYAIKNEISLSTLRRYIKANKVQYKIENGRYLLFDSSEKKIGRFGESQHDGSVQLQSKMERLESDFKKAQEEISELKMLIALYEEKMSSQNRLHN